MWWELLDEGVKLNYATEIQNWITNVSECRWMVAVSVNLRQFFHLPRSRRGERRSKRENGIMLNKHRPSLASALKHLTTSFMSFSTHSLISTYGEEEAENGGKTIKIASFIRNEMEAMNYSTFQM
jgi:hypothetical protein